MTARGERHGGLQTHLLVLDAPPQPFDDDVVAPAAFAVHADRNVVVLEHLREFPTGAPLLRPLTGQG
jgi:hypothetical protein